MFRPRLTSSAARRASKWALLGLAAAVCLPETAAPAQEPEEGEPKTVEVAAGDLTLTVPETWKKEPAANRLRLAQFTIPAPEGVKDETELTVFGGFGGSDADNLQRWADQFVEEGRKVTVVQGKGREGAYKLLDASGVWNAPDGPPMMGKTKRQPDSRMLAAIVAVPGQGNYFLKMAGPSKTVDAQVDAFRASIGGDKASEKPFALK
ncbi:hypothetical protein [Alienimonas californiensis]|uniref:PsbP C-terminal domain-containing protein n=1 Tax=Alienimonas californiensis TaxID=2527989 RepID=A0A517PCE8_9PLAN|nr:hypothetical protein [Alienimonas californiensis]QDT17058.1 hypothetical protein CA12_31690 [Alienimonas californiensis]